MDWQAIRARIRAWFDASHQAVKTALERVRERTGARIQAFKNAWTKFRLSLTYVNYWPERQRQRFLAWFTPRWQKFKTAFTTRSTKMWNWIKTQWQRLRGFIARRRTRLSSIDPKGPVPEDLELYWGLLGTLVVLYISSFAFGLTLWNVEVHPSLGKAVTYGSLLVYGALVHLVLSWRSVAKDEVGGTFFYGRPLKKARSGLHYVALGVIQLEKITTIRSQFQLPGEPEEIFWGDEHDPLEPGKVRPMILPTGKPKDEKELKKSGGDAILNIQSNLRTEAIVAFAVADPLSFFARIGSLKNAQQQLRDIAQRCLGPEFRKYTVGEIIANFDAINQALLGAVQRETGPESDTGSWGLTISAAYMLPIVLPKRIADQMVEIAKKRAEARTEEAGIFVEQAKAKQTVIQADAQRYKDTEVGLGKASAAQALKKGELVGEAQGYKAQMKALGVSGEVILAAQTAQDAFANADSIIVGGESGMRDLLGAVKGAQNVLTMGKNSPPQGGGSTPSTASPAPQSSISTASQGGAS